MIKQLQNTVIYLASQSPRRAVLFKHLGLNFTVLENVIEEDIPEHASASPELFVMSMAQKKINSVEEKVEKGLIVAADTIVVTDGMALGKPKNASNAKSMLMQLSGNVHKVYTGIALNLKPENIIKTNCEVTEVFFKDLLNTEIEEYVESGEPMDKAGAYGIQGMGALFISKVNGCFFNVMGFPVSMFYDLFKLTFQELSKKKIK